MNYNYTLIDLVLLEVVNALYVLMQYHLQTHKSQSEDITLLAIVFRFEDSSAQLDEQFWGQVTMVFESS